MSEVSSEV